MQHQPPLLPPSLVIPLPEGWEEHNHPTLMRPYWVYANCDPPFSTWDDPRFSQQPHMYQPSQRRLSNQSARTQFAGSEDGSSVSYQSQTFYQDAQQPQYAQAQPQQPHSPYNNQIALPSPAPLQRQHSNSSQNAKHDSDKPSSNKYIAPILASLGGAAIAAISGKIYEHYVINPAEEKKKKERRHAKREHAKHHESP